MRTHQLIAICLAVIIGFALHASISSYRSKSSHRVSDKGQAGEGSSEYKDELRIVPAGLLGYPLGTPLRIEGIRQPKRKFYDLIVSKVNNKELKQPITILIENLEKPFLPSDTVCVLNGYETGKMLGTPPALLKGQEYESKNQMNWALHRRFVITSIEKPKGIVLKQ